MSTALYVCYLGLDEPLVATQVRPYLRALAARGHRMHLLTFETARRDAAATEALRQALADEGIAWHALRYHRRPSLPATLYDIARGVLRGFRLARRHGIELVHARSHVGAAIALPLRSLLGLPFVFDVRGLLPDEYADAGHWRRGGLKYRLGKAMERVFFRRAAALVVLTEAVRADLSAAGGPARHARSRGRDRDPVLRRPRPVALGRAGARDAAQRPRVGRPPRRRLRRQAGNVVSRCGDGAVLRARAPAGPAVLPAGADVEPGGRAAARAGRGGRAGRCVRRPLGTVRRASRPCCTPPMRASRSSSLACRSDRRRRRRWASTWRPGCPSSPPPASAIATASSRTAAACCSRRSTTAPATRAPALSPRLLDDPDTRRRCRAFAEAELSLARTGGPRYASVYERALRGDAGVTLDLLALVPYPLGTTPSQRFRLEQWAPLLARDHDIRVHFAPFADALSARCWPGRGTSRARPPTWRGRPRRACPRSCARAASTPCSSTAPCVSPGPPCWSGCWRRARPPLLFDFDDAIWLRHTSGANALFDRLKFPGKTATLCRLADRVVVGSDYLAGWARQHSARVDVVPTSIDTAAYEVRDRPPGERVVVGWTGSATSMTHLEAAAPLLRRLAAARPVEIRVLSTRPPVLPDVPVVFRHWTPANEVEEIRAFDIGIKPMPDDEWARGKCPMKELQYLALRIPAVCSAVGGSREAVRHGDNGFLVSSEDEWMEALLRLVDDPGAARAPGRGRAPHRARALLVRAERCRVRRVGARGGGAEMSDSDTEAVAPALARGGELHRRLRPARPGSLRVLLRLQPPPPGPAAGAPAARAAGAAATCSTSAAVPGTT